MKQHLGEKASAAQGFIFKTAMLLEMLVALIVILALIIMFTRVPLELKELVNSGI